MSKIVEFVLQCEHKGMFPLLQRSGKPSETRRWRANNTDIIDSGGSCDSRIRSVHSVKGSSRGNDEGGGEGAERERNIGELHIAGGDGDRDVLQRNE